MFTSKLIQRHICTYAESYRVRMKGVNLTCDNAQVRDYFTIILQKLLKKILKFDTSKLG